VRCKTVVARRAIISLSISFGIKACSFFSVFLLLPFSQHFSSEAQDHIHHLNHGMDNLSRSSGAAEAASPG
jgi:hypothetical protein